MGVLTRRAPPLSATTRSTVVGPAVQEGHDGGEMERIVEEGEVETSSTAAAGCGPNVTKRLSETEEPGAM
jgi:hypothetical protein